MLDGSFCRGAATERVGKNAVGLDAVGLNADTEGLGQGGREGVSAPYTEGLGQGGREGVCT